MYYKLITCIMMMKWIPRFSRITHIVFSIIYAIALVTEILRVVQRERKVSAEDFKMYTLTVVYIKWFKWFKGPIFVNVAVFIPHSGL